MVFIFLRLLFFVCVFFIYINKSDYVPEIKGSINSTSGGTTQTQAVIDDTDVNTFLGVDEMVAQGVEFILDTPRIINDKLSAKFNITYTDAEITKNEKNPDYVGNDFPRLPNWRSNLLLTWAQSDSLRLSGGIRYASNSYGELDNSDTASEAYGAQDDYFFINAKVDWNVSQKAKIALGMDNINNDVAYVAHPWPGRTVYLEGKYEF